MSDHSEQLTSLQQQKALLTEQQAIASLQQKLTTLQQQQHSARLPKLTAGQTEPKGGKLEIKGEFGYLSQLVAYNQLCKSVAREVAAFAEGLDTDAKILLVSDLNQIGSSLIRLQITAQLDTFDTVFKAQIQTNADLLRPLLERRSSDTAIPHSTDSEEILTDDTAETLSIPITKGILESALPTSAVIAAALQLAPVAVGLTADVAGYFQADYSIATPTITVNNQALVTAAAGALGSRGRIADFTFIENTPLFKQLAELQTQRNQLATSQALLTALIVDEPAVSQAQAAITRSSVHVAAFDTWLKTINTASADKPTPLFQAALQAQLHEANITHLLYLNVISSGGEAITKRTWWRGVQVSYIGGGVYTYLLAKTDGEIINADTITSVAEVTRDKLLDGTYTFSSITLNELK